ncbi:MAG: hypothetical protein M1826_005627 [Phylliscum demangeonii]|nr:MAG: hypothetical protein M1826_005627 [Phylliscum demangeonii]
MSDSMAWEAQDLAVYGDDGQAGYTFTDRPNYARRAYFQSGPEGALSYDEQPRPAASWQANPSMRSLEERITLPHARQESHSADSDGAPFGMDGTVPTLVSPATSCCGSSWVWQVDVSTARVSHPSDTSQRAHKRSEKNAPDHAPSAVRTADNEASGTARSRSVEKGPDLSDLKAKVIASLSKSREANSSTPPRKESASIKSGAPTAGTSANKDHGTRAQTAPQAATGSKGSDADINDLLAEGKAAAEAAQRSKHDDQTDEKKSQATSVAPHSIKAESMEKEQTANASQPSVSSSPENTMKEAKKGVNGGADESPSRLELGEIVEEPESKPTQARPTQKDSASESLRKKSSPSTTSNTHHAPLQSKTRQTKPAERKYYEKSQDGYEQGRKEYERSAKDDTGYASRAAPGSERSHPSHDETSKASVQAEYYMDRQGRATGSHVMPAHEVSKRRAYDNVGKELEIRPPSTSRRLIETGDGDEKRSPPRSRASLAYRSTEARVDVDDAPKGVIHLADAGWADLEEWLEVTGYHDRSYRKEALLRHREIVALDIKRASLAREAQIALEERAYMFRAQAVQPREDLAPPRMVGTTSTASLSMGPPPLPSRESQERSRPFKREAAPTSVRVRSAHSYADDEVAEIRYIEPAGASGDGGNLKRRYRSDSDDHEHKRPEKLVRADHEGLAVAQDLEKILLRPVKRYAEDNERSMSEHTGAANEAEPPRRPRELIVRGREYSPPRNATRDRMRSMSPPRPTGPSAELRIYKRDEDDNAKSAKAMTSIRNVNANTFVHEPTPARKYPTEVYMHSDSEHGWHQQDAKELIQPTKDYYEGRAEFRQQQQQQQQQAQSQQQQQFSHGNHQHMDYSVRGRGRGRGGYYQQARGDHRNYNHNHRPSSQEMEMPSRTLELDQGDVRFFIVKSYNTENVKRSQEENVWVTQEKNSDNFTQAFQTSRHVILLFSINKSMAFQGYARMESVPGTAAAPSWAKSLMWKSSGPFHIRWLTVAETRFYTVGHLKNAYNEHQAVLIGRDGQEVEAECGARLCELIDLELVSGAGAASSSSAAAPA